LSSNPMIALIYTPSGLDHIKNIAPFVPEMTPCYFLTFFNWFMNSLQIIEYGKQAKAIIGKYPNIKIHALCNSQLEYQSFLKLSPSVPAHFINQNIVLDEEVYNIRPEIDKDYRAVYNARLLPFKRHRLASQVSKLSIITCGWKSSEDPYFNEVYRSLLDATWQNLDSDLKYQKLSEEDVTVEVNRARVGLIFSKVEGACFAATEYLLAGLPVVSTKSLGGRDVIFSDDASFIVDATEEAVRDGVTELLSRRLDPDHVRRQTIAIIHSHRIAFIQLVNSIIQEFDSLRDFSREWAQIFENKMMTFTDYSQFKSFVSRVSD